MHTIEWMGCIVLAHLDWPDASCAAVGLKTRDISSGARVPVKNQTTDTSHSRSTLPVISKLYGSYLYMVDKDNGVNRFTLRETNIVSYWKSTKNVGL